LQQASRLENIAKPGEILISYETHAHVKNMIHCDKHGDITIRGIAYPVATYWIIDTYKSIGQQRSHVREEYPALELDLDLNSMTTDDRKQAVDILQRALTLLSQTDISEPKNNPKGK